MVINKVHKYIDEIHQKRVPVKLELNFSKDGDVRINFAGGDYTFDELMKSHGEWFFTFLKEIAKDDEEIREKLIRGVITKLSAA